MRGYNRNWVVGWVEQLVKPNILVKVDITEVGFHSVFEGCDGILFERYLGIESHILSSVQPNVLVKVDITEVGFFTGFERYLGIEHILSSVLKVDITEVGFHSVFEGCDGILGLRDIWALKVISSEFRSTQRIVESRYNRSWVSLCF